MIINLVNINNFLKSLSSNNINNVGLIEQYYYYEIKENIEIYSELIKKLKNNLLLFDITIEQEQKYKNFFIFLKEKITETKEKYQEDYKHEIEKIDKI